MIKIYTNQTFLTEAFRKQVFPLLFDLVYVKNKKIEDYYCLVDVLEEADVIISPIAYHKFITHKNEFRTLKELAIKHSKPLFVYTAGDFGYTLKDTTVFNFRLGGFNSKLNKNTYILPSFINDPYIVLNKEFGTVSRPEIPTIGFVGHAESGCKKYIKEFIAYLKLNIKQLINLGKNDYQSFYPSGYKRAKYLKQLEKTEGIITDFIFRNKYRAGVISKMQKDSTTYEFYDNMYNNAYTLCIRGVGNFSVRFYETLAMGRIPVVIDTDCRFPLESKIDWSKHVVLVKEFEIDHLESKILEFHNQFNLESFKSLQISNRNLWLNSLQRISYFKEISSIFTS